MDSNDLIQILNQYPAITKSFKGVCSIDTIPKLKQNEFVICNTDTSTGSGKHWFVLARFSNVIECFDSLGIDETKKSIILPIVTQFNIEAFLKFNVTPVQNISSESCGKFCLYFILERLYNPDLTFDELLNSIFKESCEDNEAIVEQFFIDIQ